MKNKAFAILVLTVGFVGATSCGDNGKTDELRMEKEALKAQLRDQKNAVSSVVNVHQQVQVVQVVKTNTSVNTVTSTTATSSSTATATRQ